MRELPPLRSLVFTSLLHPGEDLEDRLVEVVGLVGENIMARSSDHLTNTKHTVCQQKVSALEIKLLWFTFQNLKYEFLHEIANTRTRCGFFYSNKANCDILPWTFLLNHILKRLDMKPKLQKQKAEPTVISTSGLVFLNACPELLSMLERDP